MVLQVFQWVEARDLFYYLHQVSVDLDDKIPVNKQKLGTSPWASMQ
jgi:hypothetical protein